MTFPDCWIRAKRLPSGPEQNCVNVLVQDDSTEKTFVMEPEDVISAEEIEKLAQIRIAMQGIHDHSGVLARIREILVASEPK